MTRPQKVAAGALVLALVASRLAAAWSQFSTTPLSVPTDGRTLSGDAITYDMPAYNLLAGNGYSNCLGAPYEPSVMRTPGYPLALAAVYSLFGRNEGAVVGMDAVFDIVAALLFFAVACHKLPAWWAIGLLGAILVLDPTSNFIERRLSEPLATLLLAGSLMLWVRARRLGHWLALGACLGALLLCRPSFALLPVAVGLWIVTLGRAGLGGRPGRVLTVLIVGTIAVWSGWAVRNAIAVGRFVPLTPAGSGLSLWLSTWSTGGDLWRIERDEGRVVRTFPDRAFSSRQERERVLPLFERYIDLYFSNGGVRMIEPDRELREIAVEKIRADPWRWLALRVGGTVKMLKQQYLGAGLLESERLWSLVAWVVGVLAVIGSLLTIRRPSWQPVSLVFLYTWLIHFPTHGEPRYLVPAYGAAVLLAGLALHAATLRVARARVAQAQESGPPQA